MDYNNFNKDQKESFWIIIVLYFFAATTLSGAFLLFMTNPIIAFLLVIVAIFLGALGTAGIFVEFVEKD